MQIEITVRESRKGGNEEGPDKAVFPTVDAALAATLSSPNPITTARHAYRQFSNDSRVAEVFIRLANRGGHYGEAIDAASKLLQGNSANKVALSLLGEAYLGAGRNVEARDQLLKLQESGGETGREVMLLCAAHFRCGDKDAALKALNSNPSSGVELRDQLLLKGQFALYEGNFGHALTIFAQTSNLQNKRGPSDGRAIALSLAAKYFQAGRKVDGLIETLHKSGGLFRSDPLLPFLGAVLLLGANRSELAEIVLRKDLDPRANPGSFFLLSKIALLGHKDEFFRQGAKFGELYAPILDAETLNTPDPVCALQKTALAVYLAHSACDLVVALGPGIDPAPHFSTLRKKGVV